MNLYETQHKIIFRLSALGDLVLTTGIMEFWAKKYGWTFTVITKKQYAAPLESNPHITEIISLDKDDLGDIAWIVKAGEIATRYAGCELIDLHSTLRSRILAIRWRGPVSRYKKLSVERRLFKLTRSESLEKKLEDTRVTVRDASAIEKELPDSKELLPRIYLTGAEKSEASSLRNDQNLDKNFIALHPYATHPDKSWPRDYWLDLIKKLDDKSIKNIIPGHGPLKINWDEAANDQIRYLTLLRDDIRTNISTDADLTAAMESIGLNETAKWQMFSHYHKRNISYIFAELEWE